MIPTAKLRIEKRKIPKYKEGVNFNEKLHSNYSFLFSQIPDEEIPSRHLAFAGGFMNIVNTKIN